MEAKRAALITHLKANPPKSFYDMAGLKGNASEAEITKAYRKLVLLLHPDKGGDTELFKVMQEFYSRAKAGEKPPPPLKMPKMEEVDNFIEVTINGKVYGVNSFGDTIDEEMNFQGHYDSKTGKLDRKARPPHYWPTYQRWASENAAKAEEEDALERPADKLHAVYEKFLEVYQDADGVVQEEMKPIEKAFAKVLNSENWGGEGEED